MLNLIRRRVRQWRVAAASHRRYRQCGRIAESLQRELDGLGDPKARFHLLDSWADLEQEIARRDSEQRDSGTDFFTVQLLRLVADAEFAIAWPQIGRCWTWTGLEPQAGPVLDRAVAAGHVDRAALEELYDAVQPIVGGQAAEVVANIPPAPQRGDLKLAG